MKLERSHEGKQVRIVTTDNEVLTGVVEDYIFPEDNEPEGVSGINVYNCPKRFWADMTEMKEELK